MKFFLLLFSTLVFLQSCSNDKIETSNSREFPPEPDKELRIQWETRQSLLDISNQVTDSDSIEICEAGRKIINSGKGIIPYLQLNFTDSTFTNVYSLETQRNLSVGEIAMVVSQAIQ